MISVRDGEVCARAMMMRPSPEAVRTPLGSEGVAGSPTEIRHAGEGMLRSHPVEGGWDYEPQFSSLYLEIPSSNAQLLLEPQLLSSTLDSFPIGEWWSRGTPLPGHPRWQVRAQSWPETGPEASHLLFNGAVPIGRA